MWQTLPRALSTPDLVQTNPHYDTPMDFFSCGEVFRVMQFRSVTSPLSTRKQQGRVKNRLISQPYLGGNQVVEVQEFFSLDSNQLTTILIDLVKKTINIKLVNIYV